MDLSELDYQLPADLIAQTPAPQRDASRLMVLDRASGTIHHRTFSQIGEWLRAGDALILNDTRVRAVRFHGLRHQGGRSPTGLRLNTGGNVEVFVLEYGGAGAARVLTRAGGKLEAGETIVVGAGDDALRVELREKFEDGSWNAQFIAETGDVERTMAAHARMPLPPYIRRGREQDQHDALDSERYQTVYASREGAVAAPTAGLHFTSALLASLEQSGVRIAYLTLHVGRGTFQPVKSLRVEAHVMHEEAFELGSQTVEAARAARALGGRIVAVGTTVTRVLETCVSEQGDLHAQSGSTRLMILPGYRFRAVDVLLTNFHLPKSTLLALVMAFAGKELIREAYACAITERYRFFSYGDAMLIL